MNGIVVIGSINQDTSLTMQKLPNEGDTVIADSVRFNGGGKGANQAVSLSRMGSQTTFVCAIGDDDVGTLLVNDLKNDNVDVIPILKKGETTGFAMITVDYHGNNSIVVYPGANYAMNEDDIRKLKSIISRATYCVLQLELQISVVKAVIDVCRHAHVPVVLNPAPF